METTFIYALCEPGTRTVRYIGKTGTTPQKRFKRHLHETSKVDSYVGRWLRLLLSRGESPSLVVFREVEGDGVDAEMRYIKRAKELGMRLVNTTYGGEGGKMPQETREKIGAKNRGANNGMFGHVWSPEEREAKRAGMKGKHVGNKNPCFGKTYAEEESAQMSLATSGRARTPEHCAALSAVKKGVRRSERSIAAQKATMARRRQEASDYLTSEVMRGAE